MVRLAMPAIHFDEVQDELNGYSMFPIYEDLNRTKLIADKSRRGTANLFGIIAYTDANPNIKKVLRDSDYWDSFNHLSAGWIIYAIRPEYGQHVTYFTDENGYKRERSSFEFNYDFLQDFGISQEESFPIFIIAALVEDDRIQAIRIPIDDSSIETANESIRHIIETATQVISGVEPKYRSSTHVLREVEAQMNALKASASFSKASRAFKRFFQTVTTAITVASNY